jgi:hypothetical protein
MTRKHNLGMDGNIGHGRHLTQNINFLQNNESPVSMVHGWKVTNSELKPRHEIKYLPINQVQHKKYWDHEPGKYFLKTSGFHSSHVDAKMGISFDDLEGLSVR